MPQSSRCYQRSRDCAVDGNNTVVYEGSTYSTNGGRELLPLIIGLKVPSDYVLVEQRSNTLPSVCVNVNHIYFPTLLFQMASIIALFLLQMFYSAVQECSQLWVDKALEQLMGK